MVDAVENGAARRWRANGWRRSCNTFAANADLWRELLPLCERHDVRFAWVQGHGDDPENERCDRLAVQAARAEGLPADVGYEEELTREASQPSLF
jgi:ribonuclease HI